MAAAIGVHRRLSCTSASRANSTSRRAPTACGRMPAPSPTTLGRASVTLARMLRARSHACVSVGAMIGRSDTLMRGAAPEGRGLLVDVGDALLDGGERLAPACVHVAVLGR